MKEKQRRKGAKQQLSNINDRMSEDARMLTAPEWTSGCRLCDLPPLQFLGLTPSSGSALLEPASDFLFLICQGTKLATVTKGIFQNGSLIKLGPSTSGSFYLILLQH